MEIIKYRYWNSNEKKMYFQPPEGWMNFPHKLRELDEWMQFTGLYDKCRKEIYRGDIVKRFSSNVEVICGNQYKQVIIKITFKKGRKVEEAFFHELWDEKEIEIIGNIYENPKLINTK